MVKKEIISEVIYNICESKNFTIKCSEEGTKGSSGVIHGQGEMPRFEYNDGNLEKKDLEEIADKMAERWGLEVSIDAKGKREIGKTKFSLWDPEHQTLLRLNKIVKHQNWIDFTNNGKGDYNLDDVLRYYDELDDIAKDHMGGVFFETNNGASYNNLYSKQYDTINPIFITNMVYGKSSLNSEYNMKQVMAHEAGHASERDITREEANVLRKTASGKNKYNRYLCTTDRERELYDGLLRGSRGDANSISSSKEYDDARKQNKVRDASRYSSGYTGSTKLTEDFAETMSAVSYRNVTDKSGFKITYKDGTTVGYDRFVSDHQATFKICCDYADGKIKHTDLHNRFNGEQYT